MSRPCGPWPITRPIGTCIWMRASQWARARTFGAYQYLTDEGTRCHKRRRDSERDPTQSHGHAPSHSVMGVNFVRTYFLGLEPTKSLSVAVLMPYTGWGAGQGRPAGGVISATRRGVWPGMLLKPWECSTTHDAWHIPYRRSKHPCFKISRVYNTAGTTVRL